MQKKLSLLKEQIKGIKNFIKNQENIHKFGSWDRFKIAHLKIHANGDYYFKIHWCHTIVGIHEDLIYQGNLFDEFPIYSVYDELDCAHLLFHPIHIKAYERNIEKTNHEIQIIKDDRNYLSKIYEIGNYYNKEGKIITAL